MTVRALCRIGLCLQLIYVLFVSLLMPSPTLAQDPPSLDEHYSTQTTLGEFSFDYPTSWTIDPDLEPGAVWLSTHSDMLTSNDYLPGEVVMAIILPTSLDILQLDFPDEDLTARVVIETFLETVEQADRRGDIESGAIGNNQVVWIDLLVENEEGMVMAVDVGGSISVILAAALPGEFEAFRETVNQIVGSISLETDVESPVDTANESSPVFGGYYENEVSGLGFQYPETWFIQDDDVPGVTFVGSLEVILDNGDPVPGGVLLIVLTEDAFAETFGDELGTNAAEIVQNTVDSFLLPIVEGASIKSFTVGENEAARTSFLSNSAEGAVIAIDLGDRYGIVIAATAVGEFPDFEATILSIAETIVVVEEAVADTQAYSSSDFAFAFDYPLGWRVDESESPELIVVGNVGNFGVDQLGTGEILVFVFDPLESGFPEGLSVLEMAEAWQTVIEDGVTEASEVEEITVGDLEAARIDVVSPQGDGIVVVIDVGDGSLAVVVASTAHDEFADFEATVLDLAASVRRPELP